MDPQSTQPPVAPSAPNPSIQPSASQMPSQQPLAPISATTPIPSSNKKPGIIIGIAIVAVLALLLGSYFLFFTDAAKSARTANSFQQAIANDDVSKAASLAVDGSSSDTQSSLQMAAMAVKGGYKLSQTTFQNKERYSLYSLNNSVNKYARVIVKKSNGKWLVSSYVYDKQPLALIPSTSTTTTPSVSSTSGSSDTTACLATSDYNVLAQDIDGSTTNSIAWTASNPYTQNVHFNPDSLDYDNTDQAGGIISAFIAFYKANTAKDYKIHLQGSVATTAQADLNFANQRSQKVQTQLEAGGVPASYIVIDTPQNVSSFSSTNSSTDQQAARDVVITVVPGCTNTSNLSTGR